MTHLTDLTGGAGYLGRGFAFLRARPRLLVLGMLPALLVLLVLTALFVVFAFRLGDLVGWLTPFADDWAGALRGLVRLLLGAALVVGVLMLFSALFVGLTLTVGDPFYARIWRETEAHLGGAVPAYEVSFLQSARDGLVLSAVGLGCSLLVVLSGFVPLVGPAFGVVLGTALSGRLVARELLGRPLEARGMDKAAQDALLRPHRSRVLGLGVATQLCFAIPFGAVLVMPSAVVAATMLARDVLPVEQ
ncbi:EI24 domain-containing protein [soil metagenome]